MMSLTRSSHTIFILFLIFMVSCSQEQELAEIGLANGIKTGEVTSDSAVIWCRTTLGPQTRSHVHRNCGSGIKRPGADQLLAGVG
jgi:hypothetical protein